MTRIVIRSLIILFLAFATFFYVRWERDSTNHEPRAQKIDCVNNLRQIGLAFRTWAVDHADQYPFNVSTNDGGTRELCVRDRDGFEVDPALHLQIITNADELTTPMLLICPEDHSKKPATTFKDLRSENVTYKLQTRTNTPKTGLLVCPIDGNRLYSDGTVERGSK